MPTPHIADGYTVENEKIIVDGKTLLTVSFRPMRGLETKHLATAQVSLVDRGYAGVKQAARMVAEAIAAHLVSWDLAEETGKVIPISADAVASLRPDVASLLELQVCYWAKEDEETEKN